VHVRLHRVCATALCCNRGAALQAAGAGACGGAAANKENEAAAAAAAGGGGAAPAAPGGAAQVRGPLRAPGPACPAAGKPPGLPAPPAAQLPPATPPRLRPAPAVSPFGAAAPQASARPAPGTGGGGALLRSGPPGILEAEGPQRGMLVGAPGNGASLASLGARARAAGQANAFCGAAVFAPGAARAPAPPPQLPPSPFSGAPDAGAGAWPAPSTAMAIPPMGGALASAPGSGAGLGGPRDLGEPVRSLMDWAGISGASSGGGSSSLGRASSWRVERQPSLQDWFGLPGGPSRASSMDTGLPVTPEDAPGSDGGSLDSGSGSPQFRLMLSPPSRLGLGCSLLAGGSPGSPACGSPRAPPSSAGRPRGAARHQWGIASPARHPGSLLHAPGALRGMGVVGFAAPAAPAGGALPHPPGGAPPAQTLGSPPPSSAPLPRRGLGGVGAGASAAAPAAAAPAGAADAAAWTARPGMAGSPAGLPRTRRGQPARRSLDLLPGRAAGDGAGGDPGSRPATPKRCRSLECTEGALAEHFAALRPKSPRLGEHYGRPLLAAPETGLAG